MNRIIFIIFVFASAFVVTEVSAQRKTREVRWVNPEITKLQGLEHKILASKSLGHEVGYAVWTPQDFDSSGKTRYPVVYFLHGAGGSEASDSGGFSARVAAGIHSGTFPEAICVFPNGGMSGYRGDVETMIVDELVPLIDHEYPTKADASARAVTGFSMGGAGAVYLSIMHPALFCAAGSWGGALSRNGTGEDSALLPASIENAESLRKNNFALLTVNGDQDHPEGFTPLNKTLVSIGITHETVILDDTKHNLGHYYERAGDTMLAFVAARLNGTQAPSTQKKIVRVLTIGNSFAQNACKYLKEIAHDGSVELIIGTANLGGCTLERHATLAKQSDTDATNRPYDHVTESNREKLSLQEYLTIEQWDFVTLQQMSALSFQPETFHPHIDELVSLVKKLAPQAKILIHETWAYRPDSPLLKEWGMTQQEMHDQLVGAYAGVAKQFDAKVIPVGTAFDSVRSSEDRNVVVPDPNFDFENPVHPKLPDQANSLVVGWYWDTRGVAPKLKLDCKHANTEGCYLAGLVWYEALTGNDATKIRYAPHSIPESDQALLRKTAHAAFQSKELEISAN